MQETLKYKTLINGQEIEVTRYPESDGKGLYSGAKMENGKVPRKRVKKAPVDKRLHALNQLLEEAKKHDTQDVVDLIEESISKRIKELTRGAIE